MTFKSNLETDLHEAMRQNDELAKNTLRMVLSALKMAEIDKHANLDDQEIINTIQKEIKMRNETLAELESTDRSDLIEKARKEIMILSRYLPSQLSDAELTALVQATITEVGAGTIKEMGLVMKSILPKINGRATSERISNAVKNALLKL